MKDPAKQASIETPSPPTWEQTLLEKVAMASLIEQRKARRWSIFFKLILCAYLLVIGILYVPIPSFNDNLRDAHTALIDVSGVIAADSNSSAERVIAGLRAAFEHKHTAGVVVQINSPGGSPVQAGQIADEMHRLQANYPDIPLYSVITDIGASGGYYIAAAADTIYADKASIIGSIGVVSHGFGFVELLKKLGIQRRMIVAGEHKALLDPFLPTDSREVRHFQGVLSEIHRQFIESVQLGRGALLSPEEELFTGFVWSGEKSLSLGLVDALGDANFVAREIIGAERIMDFTPAKSLVERIEQRIGVTLVNALLQQSPQLQ